MPSRPSACRPPWIALAALVADSWLWATEAWTSVIRTLSRTYCGPGLLDALMRLAHPAVPQPR